MGPPELEVIVVDDGSRDDSAEIAGRFPCRVLRLETGRGPAAARNHGAEAARGAHIVFVDADVLVASDTVARLTGALETCPVAFATYAREPLHRNLATRLYHALSLKSLQETDERTPVAYSYCMAVDRALFLAEGGFDARFTRAGFEDADLGWRLARKGVLATHLRDAPVVHAVHYDVPGLLRAYFRKSRDLAHVLLRQHRLSLGNQGWTRRGNWLTWAAAWGIVALVIPAAVRPWPWAAIWATVGAFFVWRSAVVVAALSRPRVRDAVLGVVVYLAAHVVATAGMLAGAVDWLTNRSREEGRCVSPT
jgi:GT2 family glycosyltransferase